MSAEDTGMIRRRLQEELAAIQRAAEQAKGPESAALETLARVFRQRLAEIPLERPAPPPRVQDVLPPAYQHGA